MDYIRLSDLCVLLEKEVNVLLATIGMDIDLAGHGYAPIYPPLQPPPEPAPGFVIEPVLPAEVDGKWYHGWTQRPMTEEELAMQQYAATAAAKDKAIATAKAQAQADAVVQYLRDHTPAECALYVQNNTANTAAIRALLAKMAMVLCVLAKQEL
ncbi:MAG: hypothetical protein BWY57_01615 [Betaproteobacteria bacterium ADurb.Bin341]|nr:MAG: hypothetical protein BWY57_01615 [Betaproteobacteria bacterium ADurb.Bin341]